MTDDQSPHASPPGALHNCSLHELSELLERGALSSTELCRSMFKRLRAAPDLNAFITLDEDHTLAQAERADKLRKSGRHTPLTGIPVAHKDIFCTRGIRTTCGSRILEHYVSPYDAAVVERLAAAGMVTLGKTNMDEFAMGSSNEASHFGPVRNPWDLQAVPGGSSGGSAAAVAARLAPVATGTDTGGSVRQPAALCGITGLKPSYGRVSRYGMVAFASSLDQAGVLARSAADAALVLGAMAGFDARDSTSVEHPVPDFSATLEDGLKGLRIGLPVEFFGGSGGGSGPGSDPGSGIHSGPGLGNQVAAAVRAALAEFEKMGATLVDISLPDCAAAVACYYIIAPAEASSNLSRYDGVRYGYRAPDCEDLTAMYKQTRSRGFGEEVKRRIMVGTYALSAGYYDAYYLQALKVRRLIARNFERAFEQCDVIMGPTTPTTAFAIGDRIEDPVAMYLNDVYTSPVNLAGLPGLSTPVGFDRDGKPMGLQIIGRYFDEARLLNVAHQYQRVTDWHTRVPHDFQ